jgi:hypothetical protein
MASLDTSYEKPNYRQAGINVGGKVTKGFINNPLNKTHTSTIPYKFETILYQNNNPKGFGGISTRFHKYDDVKPGPGQYDLNASFSSEKSASFSKKGYGNGFASSSSRLMSRPYVNMGPAPGEYDSNPRPFQVIHVKPPNIAFSKAMSTNSSFIEDKSEIPGPGHYDLDGRLSTASTRASRSTSVPFKSAKERFPTERSIAPPIGTYDVDRSFLIKKTYKEPDQNSSFILPSKKKMTKEMEKKMQLNNLLGKEDSKGKPQPGPGYYLPSKKADALELFNQRINNRISSNFLVGNLTRFGEVVQRKARRVEVPGPGSYIPIKLDEEKQLVSGSVFMSEVPRRPFSSNKNAVGPYRYNPESVPKKSFHLNINQSWM